MDYHVISEIPHGYQFKWPCILIDGAALEVLGQLLKTPTADGDVVSSAGLRQLYPNDLATAIGTADGVLNAAKVLGMYQHACILRYMANRTEVTQNRLWVDGVLYLVSHAEFPGSAVYEFTARQRMAMNPSALAGLFPTTVQHLMPRITKCILELWERSHTAVGIWLTEGAPLQIHIKKVN